MSDYPDPRQAMSYLIAWHKKGRPLASGPDHILDKPTEGEVLMTRFEEFGFDDMC